MKDSIPAFLWSPEGIVLLVYAVIVLLCAGAWLHSAIQSTLFRNRAVTADASLSEQFIATCWLLLVITLICAAAYWAVSSIGFDRIGNTDSGTRFAQLNVEPAEQELEPVYSVQEDPGDSEMDDYYEEREREAWYRNLYEHEEAGRSFLQYPDLLADPSLIDCDDFDFQEEAQAFFEGVSGTGVDYFILDEDGDFYACELLPNWSAGSRWNSGVNFEVP